MKNFKTFIFMSAAIILINGCAKENQNTSTSPIIPYTETNVPLECKIGQITDENGEIVNHSPAELTEEMYSAALTKASQRYVIPVVFHIFGEKQGNSGKIDIQRIKETLEWINNDFQGIVNPGDPLTFNDVHPDRKQDMGTFPDIEFKLARYNAKGERMNGFILYDVNHAANKYGLGNEPRNGNAEIKKIAWDNDMYMNVYITNDLYANGITNNSGVSWYPDQTMTNRNTARVVYNGDYLPMFLGSKATTSGPDFYSVITHEFGHFMNLKHAFNENTQSHTRCYSDIPDGGNEGDFVEDTPQMSCSADPSYAAQYDRFDGKNCLGETIDYGNFMNYGVYCNFTQGQITRMKAALEHPARKPLWDEANLKKTIGEDYDYVYPDLSLSFENAVLKVGETGTITAAIPTAQAVDINVSVTNPNPNVLSVPQTITIPAGKTVGTAQFTGLAGGSAKLSFFGDKADVLTTSTYINVNEDQPPTPPTPTPKPEPDSNIRNILNNKTVIINSENKMFPAINTGTSVIIHNSRGSIVVNEQNYSGNFDMYSLNSGSYYYTIKDGDKEYKGTIEILK